MHKPNRVAQPTDTPAGATILDDLTGTSAGATILDDFYATFVTGDRQMPAAGTTGQAFERELDELLLVGDDLR